ncbi:MAG: response regulator [Gemmatimonadota bacterium]
MGPDRSLNVLVVEDNPSERWLLSEILRARGHVVTACEDAESAWDLFEREPFPLVVVDWLLPGINGVDFLRKIRRAPRGDLAVVLVVTGRNNLESLEEVLLAGANDYITKPVDVGLLNIRLAVAETEVGAVEQRKRAEDALAAKTRELQTLFQNLDEVFFSMDVPNRRLIQVSPAAVRIFGVAPEQLRQQPELWSRFLFPGGWDEVQRQLTETGPHRTLTLTFPLTDGTAPQWVEASLKGEWSADGVLMRVDGVVGDVTRRKQDQEELAARNEELQTLHRISEIVLTSESEGEAYPLILDAIAGATGFPVVAIEHVESYPDRMVMVAARGITLPEEGSQLEVPMEETLSGLAVRSGRPLVELHAPGRKEHAHPMLRGLGLETWISFPMTVHGQTAGALTLAHFESKEAGPRLLRWGGSLANTVSAFMDRMRSQAALRESEEQYRALAERLQQANRELESFAYTVSHDLRAPLRTMQGFAHTLLRDHGAALSEEGRDYLRRILASGQHSETLIRDLLAYSKVSLGQLDLAAVEFSGVVSMALEQSEADLRDAGARVEVSNDLPVVVGHHTTLVQVVINLLSNAVKFVPEGRTPQIRIWGEIRGTVGRLWVEDNGMGVAAGQRDRIFRTFERLAESESRPGTGIGLAIVRRGMERMGGRAGLESTLGEGSRFWIEIPLVAVEATQRDRRGTPG